MRSPRSGPRCAAAVLSVTLILAPLRAAGQGAAPVSPPPADRIGGALFRQLAEDFVAVSASPFHWTGRDWTAFSLIAGAALAIRAGDQPLYDGLQRAKTSGSIAASAYINKIGNGAYLAGFIAALYASGELFAGPSLRATALLSLESFLTASAYVLALKAAVGRARPYLNQPPGTCRPFALTNAYASFPSGDAAAAFAVASTIAGRSDSTAVGVLAYGLAGLAAFYRVHDRRHWPSDVFVGSAIGLAVGHKVVSLHRGREGEGASLAFDVGAGRRAVSLAWAF